MRLTKNYFNIHKKELGFKIEFYNIIIICRIAKLSNIIIVQTRVSKQTFFKKFGLLALLIFTDKW